MTSIKNDQIDNAWGTCTDDYYQRLQYRMSEMKHKLLKCTIVLHYHYQWNNSTQETKVLNIERHIQYLGT